LRLGLHHHNGFAAPAGELGPQGIGHAPGGNLDQPSARVVGYPFFGPLHGRGKQRFLHRILGGGEVSEAPDHGAENLRRKLAQQVLIDGVHNGRVSLSERWRISVRTGIPSRLRSPRSRVSGSAVCSRASGLANDKHHVEGPVWRRNRDWPTNTCVARSLDPSWHRS
jgi:hypothetical protein